MAPMPLPHSTEPSARTRAPVAPGGRGASKVGTWLLGFGAVPCWFGMVVLCRVRGPEELRPQVQYHREPKAPLADFGPQKAAGASREQARPSGLRGRIATQSASGKFRAL
ncbi:hypothetical protein amb0700 [Paramagnetospirillum magneticum AMB-1]|uniref:Uncharacterized protein n=1 Tax=Paramagnetospirillum magneticum (strain ATCC 700264 / AMB-1) TaxID=342108 RepID=Q2W9H1_PARM1|nr:hypothetical protein amb0700 [Paramagnetospirillum magneticum AMB-1]